MSVMKMKWIELCNYPNIKHDLTNLIRTSYLELAQEIDNLLAEKILDEEEELPLGFYTISSALGDISSYFDEFESDNTWADLTIFVSSHKIKTKRILQELSNRLLQYLGFYRRILLDDGVARKLVTHRTYSGSGESSGEYKNYESETPQVELTNFDEAIKYASTLEKNEDTRSNSKEGESNFELKSFNWEEALRNMKMVFYNDLVRYIVSIPFLVYDYYSLEQYPVQESIKGYFDYLHSLRDIYAHR